MPKFIISPILIGAALLLPTITSAQNSTKLTGKPIGTAISVDYNNNGKESTTVNTIANAFDGNLNTFFASYERSFTWVGLELDQPHVITRVGFAARKDDLGPGRMQLAVIQGANNPDFSDALPIYLIPSSAPSGSLTYVSVNCSKGFKYVRFVGPHDARCNIAELEFYGYAGEGDESNFYQVTNLPTVVVNTPNMEWFHENDKSYELNGSTITIIDNGKIDVSAPGQIRGRGNASWNFPKKPFRIKFDKKQTVLGGPAKAKKWTMINNYGDKTLMRNIIGFELSRRIGMDYTPAIHAVDLVFNGEYQGCYQLCDQIDVNPDRVNITEMKATDKEGEALTGGYLIEIDAYAQNEPIGEWFISLHHRIPVTIKSPDPGVDEQFNYIQRAFSNMENKVIYDLNYGDPDNGYQRYLDLDSFLKHFIIGELSGNTDTYWSVYMTLDRGAEKFRTGPVWDLDLGFDNDNRTYPVNNKSDFIYTIGSLADGMPQFVNRIIKGSDPTARERLSYLWSYARKYQGFDATSMLAFIDENAAEMDASQQLNFARWPIMNQYIHQNPKVWGSYSAEVKHVKDYLKARFDRLDNLIGLVEVSQSGIDDILTEHTITPQPSADIRIYNLQGQLVYCGTDANPNLPSGLYIRQSATSTSKIHIP